MKTFSLSVRVLPSDTPTYKEEVLMGVSKCCPVAKAIGRAVRRRFRRWEVVPGVGFTLASLDRFVLGRGVLRYEGELVGELLKARRAWDFGRRVTPCVGEIYFRLDSGE
jgi:hypothetical protein